MYSPPFTITEEINNLVAAIAEIVGRLDVLSNQVTHPQLRKANRIKTIQASLAIENNSLSIDQVTAILEGKHIIGNPAEIQEVTNANQVYEILFQLNPLEESSLLKAHRIMMNGLVNEFGRYRSGGVGVFYEKGCVHLAPPANRVPELMHDLFEWVQQSKAHPLINSCVFHYELEFIHPFADGNGRMGRLWQTLLLMRWKPLFAWLPVETIIKENQQKYYEAIHLSDSTANSAPFIVFMLNCLLKALMVMQKSDQKSSQKSDQKILAAIRSNPTITIEELKKQTGLSESGIKKIIRQLKQSGILERVGGRKGGSWRTEN